MPIDTFIAGNPTDIRRVEDWIRTTLGTTIGNVADAAARARRIADDAWEGDASETYLDRSSEHVHAVDDFHERTSRTADVFAGLAGELSRALSDMAGIRARAAAAGLPVVGNTIGDPPPGDDEVAFRRASAYQEANDAAEAVHARWSVAIATAVNTWIGHVWSATFLTTTGFDSADLYRSGRVKALLELRESLRNAALLSMERFLALPDGTPYGELRRLFDIAQHPLQDLADTGRHLDEAVPLSRTAARVAGAANALGFVAGVGLDYFAGGESLEQAVASNSAGLMASMTTGAAVGAAVGSVVPIAGTAVGTVIGVLAGTAGGIFASGMVDHIYESGTSSALGTVMAGVNELGGAADATADLLDATVGGVTRLGRGVLDAVF
ncbi:hypothetical protein [Rhodococcus sp. DMU2021]|uniref:hypothetical protein n=1 Tax=Rhodococcus sp. DMU2021 TaxID=2866997 RepID=UPI0027E240CE|nr:hypothetical protein [Rhodococcus sp. DMU2021]